MGPMPHKTEKPCSFLGSDWTTLKAACLHPPSLPCRGHWGPLCQVLVSQGLLVLSSCLQECIQVHGLQLGQGLQLDKFKDEINSLPTLGLRDTASPV